MVKATYLCVPVQRPPFVFVSLRFLRKASFYTDRLLKGKNDDDDSDHRLEMDTDNKTDTVIYRSEQVFPIY